jgi:hypothetical protein
MCAVQSSNTVVPIAPYCPCVKDQVQPAVPYPISTTIALARSTSGYGRVDQRVWLRAEDTAPVDSEIF